LAFPQEGCTTFEWCPAFRTLWNPVFPETRCFRLQPEGHLSKKSPTLEDVFKMQVEFRNWIQRLDLQFARLESKIDGEHDGNSQPVTRAEIRTRDEVGKLCDRIEKLQEQGLV